MPTFKLTLAYDGTDFAGWQVQARERTVQGALEETIGRITGQQVRVAAASRTDAGVHALGQVAAFSVETRLSPEVLARALNAKLPPDVAVLAAEEAQEGFHPTRDAVRKRYRYAIHDGPVRDVFRRRYAWHVFDRLDDDAMRRAARALVGKHDFASFQSAGSPREDTVRAVFELSVRRGRAGGRARRIEDGGWRMEDEEHLAGGLARRDVPAAHLAGGLARRLPADDPQGRAGEGDLVLVEIEGDGFLYRMVRAIVGTLVEVGRAKRPEAWPARVLAARNRSAAGRTAPPEGLCLMWVGYGE